jgi:hypothetical protein
MRLAEVERELLKLAKTYGYDDVNFTTQAAGRDHGRLTISAFMHGDPSVGVPDGEDTFHYKLETQYTDDEPEMPRGYAVELLGQIDFDHKGTVESVTKHLRPVQDDETRVLALDLGNIAARKLFHEVYFDGGKL